MSSESSSGSKPVADDVGKTQVACEVCLTEVPASGAKSEETSDYVAHFCGSECYEKWREDPPER